MEKIERLLANIQVRSEIIFFLKKKNANDLKAIKNLEKAEKKNRTQATG